MLARRSTLQHPLGLTMELPRLVPSFSSKGFPLIKVRAGGKLQSYSSVTLALELMGKWLKDTMLISAYDLHHKKLRKPHLYYKTPEFIFIDSGGYELSREYDSTEPDQDPYISEEFDLKDYIKILNKLQKKLPLIIANFDWGSRHQSLNDQILDAQKLFIEYPDFIHNFIVKPEKSKDIVSVQSIVGNIEKLKAFHILGLTEKELGKNLLDRLKNIAKIRSAMNRENVMIPIHIYGGLDPLISPLYFFVGAEIFDGTSWLRYAYNNGMAVYRDAFSAVEYGIGTSFDQGRASVLSQNAIYLTTLTTKLKQFVDGSGKDFSMFGPHSKFFKSSYDDLSTRIPELKGGK